MKKANSIFPLWDINTVGEFRKKAPEIRKNDIPAKAPIPRVKIDKPKEKRDTPAPKIKKAKVEKPPKPDKEPVLKKPRSSLRNNIADKEPYDIVKIRKPRKKKEDTTDSPSKKCIFCNTAFYRKRHHTDEKWETLNICPNPSCIGKYAKSCVGRSGPIPKEGKPKVCIICNKTFYKPKTYTLCVWEKQQVCSKKCAGQLFSLNSIEDDSEPDTIAISPRIKMSPISISIPDIVMVELQSHAAKNNVSTSDVALVAMIEFLLAIKPEDRTIKTTIRRLFKKEPKADDKPSPPSSDI